MDETPSPVHVTAAACAKAELIEVMLQRAYDQISHDRAQQQYDEILDAALDTAYELELRKLVCV